MPVSGIYYIRNTVNGRMYIGQSQNIASRIATHRAGLKNHTHNIPDMQTDWDRYGEGAFVYNIIYRSSGCEDLFTIEDRCIQHYKELCSLYNPDTAIHKRYVIWDDTYYHNANDLAQVLHVRPILIRSWINLGYNSTLQLIKNYHFMPSLQRMMQIRPPMWLKLARRAAEIVNGQKDLAA